MYETAMAKFLFILWTAYWIFALTICAVGTGKSACKLSHFRTPHLWALISLQIILFLNLFCSFIAEINWNNQAMSDPARVIGMLATTLMVGLFPLFINTRKALILNRLAGYFFTAASIAFFVYFTLSSGIFFISRSNTSHSFFNGTRHLSSFGVFILLGLAVLYSCTAILVSSSISKASGLMLLRKAAMTAGALFPLILIIDLIRYFFPLLWDVLPQERQLFTPLCFLILNLYFMKYTEAAFSGAAPQSFNGLSVRENQVASLLCEGESYKEIASRLFISLATVQTHVSKIYRKTGVKTKADLILLKNRSVLPYDPEKSYIHTIEDSSTAG